MTSSNLITTYLGIGLLASRPATPSVPGIAFYWKTDGSGALGLWNGSAWLENLPVATLTFGAHLTGTSFNGSAATTLATDATNANTASTIVARDASGNFSAGTITASLTGTVNGNTITTSTGTLTLAAGSTLVTSGAYSITLMATAATVATLPAGTTTLASTTDIQRKPFRTVTYSSSSSDRTLSMADANGIVFFDTSGGDIVCKAPLSLVASGYGIETTVLMVGGGVVDFVTDFSDPVATRFGGLVNVNNDGNGAGGKIILTNSVPKFVGIP